jgi:TPR repeat protein
MGELSGDTYCFSFFRPEFRTSLTSIYYHGRGISRDYKAAIKLFKLTADQGHVVAQYNLGRAYALGQDVIDDLTRA